MALESIHTDVKNRMWEKFSAVEREAYANGFDLRHYRQDILKKSLLDSFCIHAKTEDEYIDQIDNNAWIFNYILQKGYNGLPTLDIPAIFQHYCKLYAEDMYDVWFNMFVNEIYE